jgi:hypothetical protein
VYIFFKLPPPPPPGGKISADSIWGKYTEIEETIKGICGKKQEEIIRTPEDNRVIKKENERKESQKNIAYCKGVTKYNFGGGGEVPILYRDKDKTLL